jgi:hypothetical protein
MLLWPFRRTPARAATYTASCAFPLVAEVDPAVPGTPTYREAWLGIIEAADEANEPGRFTAFMTAVQISLFKIRRAAPCVGESHCA